MTTTNVSAQGISWTVFGSECLQAVNDLRWMIIFAALLIATDFWWGVRELSMLHNQATSRLDKERTKFHFSQAGRRTLNKAVDYLTYLLVGCVAGLAITEPMGIATHTVTAAVGLGFGCLFELSSIVGHIAAVKGINIRLNLKRLLVAIVKHKSEELAEVIDEGIEDIHDNRRKPHGRMHLPHERDDYDYWRHMEDDPHDNGDIFMAEKVEPDNTQDDETKIEENGEEG